TAAPSVNGAQRRVSLSDRLAAMSRQRASRRRRAYQRRNARMGPSESNRTATRLLQWNAALPTEALAIAWSAIALLRGTPTIDDSDRGGRPRLVALLHRIWLTRSVC